jgi:phage tail-like protein
MASPATPGTPPDPFREYQFTVDIDPQTKGHFHYCEGLGVTAEVIEYKEGGSAEIKHKFPGPIDYPPVRLKFGVIHGDCEAIWAWVQSVVEGAPVRKNVSLIVNDAKGAEKMRWSANGAWPCRFVAGTFDAMGRGMLAQELVLAFDELKLVSQPPNK